MLDISVNFWENGREKYFIRNFLCVELREELQLKTKKTL